MKSPTRVLFVCTGNACRSQMAEGLLRHVGGERFESLSVGSHPAGYIHPIAIQTMRAMGIDISNQRSKSWDEMADRPIDIVITLCDSAATEPCPAWRGPAVTAHWSMPDPSFHPGNEGQRLAFARAVADRLAAKIEQLASLPLDELSDEEIGDRLARIAML